MVKRFAGHGADNRDLERGYLEPSLTESPEYDKQSYAMRSTMAKGLSSPDFMFNGMESKGFLTRPNCSTER